MCIWIDTTYGIHESRLKISHNLFMGMEKWLTNQFKETSLGNVILFTISPLNQTEM